jgi:hypothetical protein
MMTEYGIFCRIDDIPNYPTLFIRDGDFIFVVDKHTGEISDKLTLTDYVCRWRQEWDNNSVFRSYYTLEYFTPKDHPDTAKDIAELYKLCSDKTRHRKGDDGFLLDFLWTDSCTITETKLFKYLCDNVAVWNYSVIDTKDMHTSLGLKSKKNTGRIFKSLQDKGLIKLLDEKFDVKGEWRSLVKLHPKLFWKGRHSAWAVAIGNQYEYEEDVELS